LKPAPTSDTSDRPITLLIAALGGEGGGVLTDWIVSAASACGFPVQSTSIPGVAQRTGATTYYVEMLPIPSSELGSKRPVLALTPGIGDIDLFVASELMEGARGVAFGFVTRERTTAIASTSRFYAMNEKIAMGDGRHDPAELAKAIVDNARAALLFDMAAAAKEAGAIVNSVMLGAIAGSGQLPISVEAFEAAIKADGKAVESNLRGFRAGLDAVRNPLPAANEAEAKRPRGEATSLAALEQRIAQAPLAAQDIIREGVRRLAAYQDADYAKLFLDRLDLIRAADDGARADGRLLRETARHLAVRMSFEDVIRVAQAKIDPARFARIAAELKLKPGEPYVLTEFLKPGIEEMCSVLPPGLARRIIATAEQRGWLGRVHWGMEVQSTSISGYLRFWLLAKLRRFRRRNYRYAAEQAQIDSWLALIREAAGHSAEFAIEVAECARLIKGYGDTHKRGLDSFRTIEARVIRPALAGELPLARAVDAIASARAAALVDPEGESLARCLAALDAAESFRIAAE
jgi:indolepyruvate ferredoxin oxidoreductase beta subunit